MPEEPDAIILTYVLENDPTLIPGVLAELEEAALRFHLFDEATAVRVFMAVHEAILNAMQHGNLELDSGLRQGDDRAYHQLAAVRRRRSPYTGRRVHIRAEFDPEAACFIIRDEGPGFDAGQLPDPTQPPSLERASGRGLLLIRSYMDEVRFNTAGNEITLIKRRACQA